VLPSEWVAGEPAERLQLDGDGHRRHLATIKAARDADPERFKALIQGFYAERAFEARTDPDAMLYDGFVPTQDKALFEGIRASSATQLARQSWSFRDARLPELLFRYRARNYPETLSSEEQAQWREHCQSRYQDADSPFNLAQFAVALAEERSNPALTAEQHAALNALDNYVKALSAN
jgi:exodeoxyribonuclease I